MILLEFVLYIHIFIISCYIATESAGIISHLSRFKRNGCKTNVISKLKNPYNCL